MIRLICMVILFTSCYVVNAKSILCGIVKEKHSNTEVPYANVFVCNEDSTYQRYASTNYDGRFEIVLPIGDYNILISSLGFKSIKENIKILTGDSIKTCFYLESSSHELNEIIVLGKKRLVRVIEDGIVYDMAKNDRAQSEYLFQSLRYVPYINVSSEGEITTKGHSNYSIYLNGKPYTIAQSNPISTLQSIPTSSISKIEVITEPGVKYNVAQGTIIINLITREKILDGYALNINVAGNTQPTVDAGINMLSTIKNVDFSLNYNYNLYGQREQPIEQEYQYFTDNNSLQTIVNNGYGDGDWHKHTIRAMFNWNVDSINSLYFDTHSLLTNTDFTTLWQQNVYGTNGDYLSIPFVNRNKSFNGAIESNIIYRNFFRDNSSREHFSLGYRFTYNPDVRKFREINFQDTTETIRQTNGSMKEHTFQADLFVPLHDNHQLRFKAKDILRNGATKSTTNISAAENNTLDSYNMNYTQNIVYTRMLYAYRMPQNITLNAGATFEYSHLRMQLPLSPAHNFNRNNFDVTPNISIYWNNSESSNMKLSYSSSIKRPGITQLNPFVMVFNDYSMSQGNPNLKSERIDNAEYNYTIFKNNIVVSATAFYNHVDDAILYYNRLTENDNIILSTYGNLGSINKAGINLYCNYKPLNLLSLTVTGNVSYYGLRANEIGLKQDACVYNISTNLDLYLRNNWHIGATFSTHKQTPAPWSTINEFYRYSFNADKSFLNGQLTIGAYINSPFNKYIKSERITMRDNFRQRQVNYITARGGGIKISYTLSSGKKVKIKRNMNLNNADQQTGVE